MRRRRKLLVLLSVLIVVLFSLVAVLVVSPGASPRSIAYGTSATVADPTAAPTATVWHDPSDAAQAAFAPTRLVIPKIGLKADVIPVGVKANGAMDTPHCVSVADPVCGKVFWWSVGAVPGQNGNVVIAGHINRPDASPASFWFLYKLAKGDTVTITVANGTTLTYSVTDSTVVTAYAEGANNPILNAIFGPAAVPQLNLITCFGDWDGATFDHRLVVRLQLVGKSPYPGN